MTYKRSKVFPIFLTILILVIVIYLFANLEQSTFTCSKRVVDELNIIIIEDLETKLDGRKISEMQLTKTIILPENYSSSKYTESIKYTLEQSYLYLGKDKVKVDVVDNRIIVKVDVKNNETIVLNNIEFNNTNNNLAINIITNTKSSDVVTLKVNDNYTQGELITHMKNNGYNCD